MTEEFPNEYYKKIKIVRKRNDYYEAADNGAIIWSAFHIKGVFKVIRLITEAFLDDQIGKEMSISFETFSPKLVEQMIVELRIELKSRINELEEKVKKQEVKIRKLQAFVMDHLMDKEEQ